MNTPATDSNTEPLLDTPLIPPDEFRQKMKAIMSVPKSELDEHIRNNPDPPQKRGRKAKELAEE